MEFKILYAMTVLNILMLILNVWMRFDSEKTLEEIKERGGFNEASESD